MKLQNKILLINCGLVITATFIMAFITDTFPGNGFFLMFGIIAIMGGISCLALGLLLLVKKNKNFAKGYMISAVLLLLIGIVSYFTLDKF